MDLIWDGPKIINTGKGYLGYYNLQLSFIPIEFEEIGKKLSQNEFRSYKWGENVYIYQFVCSISKEEHNLYRKGDKLEINGFKILEQARDRADPLSMSKAQIRNRQNRELEWKKWYKSYNVHKDKLKYDEYMMNDKMDQIELRYESKLLPFQIKHTKQLLISLLNGNNILDASDTGTGKTYISLCLVKELGMMPIIICPKSVISSWRYVCKYYELSHYYVSNYEQYRNGNTRYLDRIIKNNKSEYEWKLNLTKDMLIFDECHKVKNVNTLNYVMYEAAKKQNIKVISLSATVADKVENIYPICHMLGLANNHSDFISKYDINKDIMYNFGYEMNNNGNYRFNEKYHQDLEEIRCYNKLYHLHKSIFPFYGSRMVIKQLGKDFPDNFIEGNIYNMGDNAINIQEIYKKIERNRLKLKYDNLSKLKRELEESNEVDKIMKLKEEILKHGIDYERGVEEYKMNYGCHIVYRDEDNDNLLTMIIRARQKIELLKLDTLMELILKFLEEKKSIVIFLNFNDTLNYLKENLILRKIKDISVIRGGQTMNERDQNIELFQNNTNRIMIANIKSGGVGISLHDIHGNHPRVSLISPNWSAQDLVQALGRIHRSGGKTKCLQYLIFCADTIEEKICSIVRKKINNIDMINDGDLSNELNVTTVH